MRILASTMLVLLAFGASQQALAADQSDIDAYLSGSPSGSPSGKGKGKSSFAFRLGGMASMVDYDFRNTDGFGPTLSWDGPDVQGDEWQFGLDASTELKIKDSLFVIEYQGLAMTSFSDASTQDVTFGNTTVPAGSDLDVRSSLHHVLFEYRKMGWEFGDAKQYSLGYSYGLAYDFVRMGLNSDAFPVEKDSDRMKEMIPYPVIGLHLSWALSKSYDIQFSGRLGYLPEVTTLQKRGGEDLNQETLYAEFGVLEEYRVNKWFSLWARARYQIFDHKLVGDGAAPSGTTTRVEQTFEMTTLSLSIGVGLRF